MDLGLSSREGVEVRDERPDVGSGVSSEFNETEGGDDDRSS